MFMWLLSFLLFTADGKKRVCVIGVGPSGLISVKHLADHPDEFETVAFERNSDVGGLWIYTDDTGIDEHGLPVHSSVYKDLRYVYHLIFNSCLVTTKKIDVFYRTNSPKEVMTCPEYQHFEGEKRSCVKHEYVVDYQKNYTDHFNLRQFIKVSF